MLREKLVTVLLHQGGTIIEAGTKARQPESSASPPASLHSPHPKGEILAAATSFTFVGPRGAPRRVVLQHKPYMVYDDLKNQGKTS